MSKRLLASIRNNPKDVRFKDACKVAESLGFVHKGGKGSHRAFSRSGEQIGLNFQDRNGKIPAYQARQLIGCDGQIREGIGLVTLHYPAEVFWSEEDEGWIAVAPDLPDCCAFGESRPEALKELEPAIEAWIEAAKAAGNAIPQPTQKLKA